MKRIFLPLVISSFSVLAFAQPGSGSTDMMADSGINVPEIHNRISELENKVSELKASNENIQKQLAEIKRELPIVKKKKLSVDRRGSKQPVWIEEND